MSTFHREKVSVRDERSKFYTNKETNENDEHTVIIRLRRVHQEETGTIGQNVYISLLKTV